MMTWLATHEGQAQNALIGVIAWFYTNIYDGAPDGGGVPESIEDAEDVYAASLGATTRQKDPEAFHAFINHHIRIFNRPATTPSEDQIDEAREMLADFREARGEES